MHFLLNGLTIVLLDLVLAGDNALVIAMAVRSLPKRERRIGIAGGAAGAVILRVGLTVIAARLLTFEFVKLAGGLFVLWIALKVLVDASDPPDSVPAPSRFWQAIGYIIFADLTMSIDNILAIAGTAKGNMWLIVFGLCLSIPFVVFSSNLLADLMEKYSIIVYIGSGILGRVGGDMILTDGFIERTLHPSALVRYSVEGALVVLIVVTGWWLCRRRKCRMDPPPPHAK